MSALQPHRRQNQLMCFRELVPFHRAILSVFHTKSRFPLLRCPRLDVIRIALQCTSHPISMRCEFSHTDSMAELASHLDQTRTGPFFWSSFWGGLHHYHHPFQVARWLWYLYSWWQASLWILTVELSSLSSLSNKTNNKWLINNANIHNQSLHNTSEVTQKVVFFPNMFENETFPKSLLNHTSPT